MKFRPCQIRDSQWVDYLENNLNPHTVVELEKHLLSCAQCRKNLEVQRKWLQIQEHYLKPDKAASTLTPEELVKMNDKIMRTVRLEATQNRVEKSKKRPFWYQRTFWYQAAGSAALIVLLAVSFRLIMQMPALTGAAIRSNDLVEYSAGENPEMAKSADQSDRGKSTDAATATVAGLLPDSKTGWQIYSGSFADLPAARIFFDDPIAAAEGTGSETNINETAASLASDAAISSADAMGLVANKFNDRGKAIYAVLSQADSMRVLTDQNGSNSILILASYTTTNISDIRTSILKILEGCQTSIKIEIIKTEDLPGLLDSYEKNLFDKTFETTGKADQSWISILIGA